MTEWKTERLLIRDFSWADEAAVHGFASDPAATRFMDWGPNDIHDTRAFIAMAVAQLVQRERTEFAFATLLAESERLIGSISIQITDRQNQQGEIGYIFDPAVWSRGYATEATRALLDFGFGTLELHRIAATCHPDNIGSARVLEKVGMSFEGRMRDHKLVRGQWRDSLLYATVNRRPDRPATPEDAGRAPSPDQAR
jgi:[ribosomal protein S5]-alanine N-acetyltransferase